jgi:hypothetical protein
MDFRDAAQNCSRGARAATVLIDCVSVAGKASDIDQNRHPGKLKLRQMFYGARNI